jgi:hypothetical protein
VATAFGILVVFRLFEQRNTLTLVELDGLVLVELGVSGSGIMHLALQQYHNCVNKSEIGTLAYDAKLYNIQTIPFLQSTYKAPLSRLSVRTSLHGQAQSHLVSVLFSAKYKPLYTCRICDLQ